MITYLFTFGARHRLLTLLFLVAGSVIAAAGLPKLTVDTSFDSLIARDDPRRQVYQSVLTEFGSDDLSIVYVRDTQLWTPEKLARVEELQRAIKRIPLVNRVDSLFSLRTVESDRGFVDSLLLIDKLPYSNSDALEIRDRALDNPLYEKTFFSADGLATALIVTLKEPIDAIDNDAEVHAAFAAVVAEYQADFDELFAVGGARLTQELKTSLLSDLAKLAGISALVLIATILFFLRSALAAILPVVTSAIALLWTFGFLGWLGVPLNILSAMVPSLIIVIGSTEDTHIMAAYFSGLRATESGNRQLAIRRAAQHVGLPLILTVLTTSLGFASNLLTSIDLVRDFAIASTFAMIANGLITMLAAPFLLSFLGRKTAPAVINSSETESGKKRGLPQYIVAVFNGLRRRYSGLLLLTTALATIFFIVQATHLKISNDPLSYFPADRPLVSEAEKIHEDLAGIRMFYIRLRSKHDKAFLEPENIAKLQAIQEFMQRQKVYDHSLSLADHLAFVNRQFRGPGVNGKLPESRQLVSQYLLFFQRGDISRFLSHDAKSANIIVRHNIGDSFALNRYINELETVVQNIAGTEIDTAVVGENLLVSRGAESLMQAQLVALALLLLLIFLMMSLLFTSFKGGAIAMIPSIIPIATMFGMMGLLEIPLNPGSAMVAVIAVGIAIDGAIHLLARYNELSRRSSDYATAVRIAVEQEATPLIASGLALALGFAVLMLSSFTVVAEFGALAAATMLASIVANLLITPIVLVRVRLVSLYQIISLKIDRNALAASPLFHGMNSYEIRKAVLISELNEFADGELLVKQGEMGRCMYLILDGAADVIRHNSDADATLATLSAGQIFGEVGFSRDAERTADVRASTAVSALRFDYNRMQNDLQHFPKIVAKLNANISTILGTRLADALDAKQ